MKGIDITGLCFSRPVEGLLQMDITDPEAMTNLITTTKPNLVIHRSVADFTFCILVLIFNLLKFLYTEEISNKADDLAIGAEHQTSDGYH